ncbi:MAG TPA: hypothetical protein VHB99_09380 [Pirellulales bacterium]|nr:hypothetical protein [Pirellulales bacterium]
MFAITTALAAVLALSQVMTPSGVGMLGGFVFTALMVVRWPTKGFLVGIVFMWASVVAGLYIENESGSETMRESIAIWLALAFWSALGWLYAAIYLAPIYLLRLAFGYWSGRTGLQQIRSRKPPFKRL